MTEKLERRSSMRRSYSLHKAVEEAAKAFAHMDDQELAQLATSERTDRLVRWQEFLGSHTLQDAKKPIATLLVTSTDPKDVINGISRLVRQLSGRSSQEVISNLQSGPVTLFGQGHPKIIWRMPVGSLKLLVETMDDQLPQRLSTALEQIQKKMRLATLPGAGERAHTIRKVQEIVAGIEEDIRT